MTKHSISWSWAIRDEISFIRSILPSQPSSSWANASATTSEATSTFRATAFAGNRPSKLLCLIGVLILTTDIGITPTTAGTGDRSIRGATMSFIMDAGRGTCAMAGSGCQAIIGVRPGFAGATPAPKGFAAGRPCRRALALKSGWACCGTAAWRWMPTLAWVLIYSFSFRSTAFGSTITGHSRRRVGGRRRSFTAVFWPIVFVSPQVIS